MYRDRTEVPTPIRALRSTTMTGFLTTVIESASCSLKHGYQEHNYWAIASDPPVSAGDTRPYARVVQTRRLSVIRYQNEMPEVLWSRRKISTKRNLLGSTFRQPVGRGKTLCQPIAHCFIASLITNCDKNSCSSRPWVAFASRA